MTTVAEVIKPEDVNDGVNRVCVVQKLILIFARSVIVVACLLKVLFFTPDAIPARAAELDPRLQEVWDAIQANNAKNKDLQCRFDLDYTSTKLGRATAVVWRRLVAVKGDSVRMDIFGESNVEIECTIVMHTGEVWQHDNSPDFKRLLIVPADKMDEEFVFDPRYVGNFDTRYSLSEILTKFPCIDFQEINKQDERIVRCTLDEVNIKEMSVKREMYFSSRYDYMPVLVRQFVNGHRIVDHEIKYSKPEEHLGWIFCDMTYTWNAPDDFDFVDKSADATKKNNDLEKVSNESDWTSKLNIKLTYKPVESPIPLTTFLVPNDLPEGTDVIDTIRNPEVEVEKVSPDKSVQLGVSIYVRIILVCWGIVCLLVAYFFRNSFQKE
jgi:hypothetical protein